MQRGWESMTDLFPIEQEICKELSDRARKLTKHASPREWTSNFKTGLYELAEKYNLEPWGLGAGDKRSEWLWDVCWAKLGGGSEGEKDWKDLEGIFLASEIEWDYRLDYILEDFLKLTVSKAEYRLFVFACKKEADVDSVFSMLKRHCPGSEGARYMAIAVPDDWKCENEILLPHCGWTL